MTILNTDAIRRADVRHDPYDFFMGTGALNTAALPALKRDFPNINKTGFHPLEQMNVHGAFKDLIAEIVGDDVQIYVQDSGPGIADDMKAQVFERFSAKSREGKRAGAGLGLALVNRFVELHDGWVEIESGPGTGTLVRAHLPRRLPEAPPPTDQRDVA
ncbi:MAG TPA: ATP-binding protein [Rhizomicrobium sp.]